ncbi:MAG: DsbA family protein [Maricaulaceae bacterium]
MIRRMSVLAVPLFALVACEQAAPPTAEGFSEGQKAEFGQLVRAYLVENPEVLEEALLALQTRRQSEQRAAQAQTLADAAPALYQDARDVSFGPDDAKVTVVEFFDYNCSFCKLSADWIAKTIAEQPDVRFVFKELPIFEGKYEGSGESALAALAVGRQSPTLYFDFHQALMKADGGLTSERIDTIAADVGADVDQMRADMENEAIQAHIKDNFELARAIGLTGTPGFVVNGEFVSGANFQQLDTLIAEGLAG